MPHRLSRWLAVVCLWCAATFTTITTTLAHELSTITFAGATFSLLPDPAPATVAWTYNTTANPTIATDASWVLEGYESSTDRWITLLAVDGDTCSQPPMTCVAGEYRTGDLCAFCPAGTFPRRPWPQLTIAPRAPRAPFLASRDKPVSTRASIVQPARIPHSPGRPPRQPVPTALQVPFPGAPDWHRPTPALPAQPAPIPHKPARRTRRRARPAPPARILRRRGRRPRPHAQTAPPARFRGRRATTRSGIASRAPWAPTRRQQAPPPPRPARPAPPGPFRTRPAATRQRRARRAPPGPMPRRRATPTSGSASTAPSGRMPALQRMRCSATVCRAPTARFQTRREIPRRRTAGRVRPGPCWRKLREVGARRLRAGRARRGRLRRCREKARARRACRASLPGRRARWRVTSVEVGFLRQPGGQCM